MADAEDRSRRPAPQQGGTPAPKPASRPSAAPVSVDAPGKTADLLLSAPRVEIPKGGGAIRGMGEKFQANPVTGTSSISVPISLSPGRNGVQPSLALSYDSGSGNGLFGLGWNLAMPSVRRKTDKGLPRYRDATDGDTFVLSEAEDLVPWKQYNATTLEWEDVVGSAIDGSVTYDVRFYRPRVESGFARVERWTDPSTGSVHWRTRSRANVLRIYGLTDDARVVDPDKPGRVFEWLIEEERDELGNVIAYEYETVTTPEAGIFNAGRSLAGNTPTCTYPKRIFYGNATAGSGTGGYYFEVVFDYGEHSTNSHKPAGAASTRLDPYSRYRSGFDIRCARLCRRVLVFHRFDNPTESVDDLTDDATLVRSTEFAYEPSEVATTLTSARVVGWNEDGTEGDSLPEVEFGYIARSVASEVAFLTGVEDLPGGLDMSRFQWVDLDGEGLSGLLTEQAGAWYYKRNNGNGDLGPARALPTRPSAGLSGSRLMDLDGDGRLELVQTRGGVAGSFARTTDGDWEPFREFRKLPRPGLDDPRARLLDLDGDGLVDLLLTTDLWLLWFPSEGVDGFGDAEQVTRPADEAKGPVALYSSETETVFFADMSGDGLTDIVWVRNGNVCYWPNKGYGRFGARVQMQGAPRFDSPDRFDARRVRLADIDGAGPADVLYLGATSVRYWSNRSGNSFSPTAATVPAFPGVDNSATVTVADVLGDGTQCLVWASKLLSNSYAPIRYVRLMENGKPYLLQSIDNHLGRTTSLTYRSSTAFYVQDRRDGHPWATRLHFPVQCLWQVTVADSVTGWSNTTEYAYHHGYFDGREREFRGFGKVEQWDTESFPTEGDTTVLPPVRTVTWFHIGAWRENGTLLDAYEAEYFAGDPIAPAAMGFETADADPASWSATEWREAYRALKGKPLRQEVYAEDDTGPGVEDVPYLATSSTYTVERLQRVSGDVPGVFFVAPLETLKFHYERDAEDPRVVQELTLEVDAYGTVTRAASVAFPRMGAGTWDDEQMRGVVIVTETEVINDVDTSADRWHVGVPWRATAWHLTDESEAFSARLTVAGLNVLFEAGGTASLAWDDAEPSSGDWKRRVSDKIVTYDDGGEADAGTMGDRALVYQTYQLVYTTTQATTLSDLVGGPDLDRLGYIDLTGESPFASLTDVAGEWARSGTQVRDDAHFYVATALNDPFGNTTSVSWHASYLFPSTVTDALGNEVSAEFDLRALAPKRVEDPNGNEVQAAFDALGRVTKTAVAGKVSGEGDTLSSPTMDFEYHLDVVPAYTVGRVRETHGVDASVTRWVERTAYSDGAGSVVMEKVTAAPDPDTSADRWVGTGRVVLNNKGLPIKQYEPFYSDDADFEAEEGFEGVTPIMTYDPLGRPTRVDLPNGTFRTVEFDPWSQTTYDENDNVIGSEWSATRQLLPTTDPAWRASELAAEHDDTPTRVYLDVQGRVYKTEELLAAAGDPLLTTLTLDVVGNPTQVIDARAWAYAATNLVDPPFAIQAQTFDLLGRPIATASPDGGDVTALLDVAGQPLFVSKEGDLGIETEVDALRRKVRTWQWDTDAATKVLRERFVYGEALEDTGVDPADDNLRGKLYRTYDTAGLIEVTYDFKGNVLSTARRFFDDEEEDIDWSGNDAVAYPYDPATTGSFDTAATVASLHAIAVSELQSDTFTVSQTFDAMNRVHGTTSPNVVEAARTTTNTYDEGGRLTAVAVDSTDFVEEIQYNARGQRTLIRYGNGVETVYGYEADTFRLDTLVTTRASDSKTLQDLRYTYDPVGNITDVENEAEDDLYFDNALVEPHQQFEYDALYRLTNAWGREKSARGRADWEEPDYGELESTEAVQAYEQRYTYDEVGNIAEMRHLVNSATDWVRTYEYEEDATQTPPAPVSNRLVSTSESAGTVNYQHDARGNIVFLPHLYNDGATPSPTANVTPDFRDQMRRAELNAADYAEYFYDASGQRARKVVKKGANVEDRRYVAGYEVWTKSNGSGAQEERASLHVMDGEQRIAIIETLTWESGSAVSPAESRVRFQLGNQLGTSILELTDGDGDIISYEEYHPYGTCAWRAGNTSIHVSRRRYRYTGMERDEETGLQYHSARYYAAWLGRWGSADPIGLGDGTNIYAYTHANPIGRHDPTGMADGPPPRRGTLEGERRYYFANLSQPISQKITMGFSMRGGTPLKLTEADLAEMQTYLVVPDIMKEQVAFGRSEIRDYKSVGQPLYDQRAGAAVTVGTLGEFGMQIQGTVERKDNGFAVVRTKARIVEDINFDVKGGWANVGRDAIVSGVQEELQGQTYFAFSDWYDVTYVYSPTDEQWRIYTDMPGATGGERPANQTAKAQIQQFLTKTGQKGSLLADNGRSEYTWSPKAEAGYQRLSAFHRSDVASNASALRAELGTPPDAR